MVIALAGLGIAVVNALAESAWGTFTIGVTIPLAIFMGFYMFKWRKGRIQEATIIGVSLMMAGVILGKPFAASSFGHLLVLTPHQITIALAVYGFAASVMPVWMLLDAARVPQHLHEDRDHPDSGARRDAGEPGAADAGHDAVRLAAADRSSPVRCSRSCSSRSPAVRSPASTR